MVCGFAQACAYDRAGFGWSDAGPLPRTAGRILGELRALLVTAGVGPP
jgi:pimeloyl-ACP methyl ester carboxylesterase